MIMVTRDGAKCKQLLGSRFSIVLWELSTTRFFFWKPAAAQKSTFLFSELAKGRSRILAIPIGCSSDVA